MGRWLDQWRRRSRGRLGGENTTKRIGEWREME
jgi:hypothetical protein